MFYEIFNEAYTNDSVIELASKEEAIDAYYEFQMEMQQIAHELAIHDLINESYSVLNEGFSLPRVAVIGTIITVFFAFLMKIFKHASSKGGSSSGASSSNSSSSSSGSSGNSSTGNAATKPVTKSVNVEDKCGWSSVLEWVRGTISKGPKSASQVALDGATLIYNFVIGIPASDLNTALNTLLSRAEEAVRLGASDNTAGENLSSIMDSVNEITEISESLATKLVEASGTKGASEFLEEYFSRRESLYHYYATYNGLKGKVKEIIKDGTSEFNDNFKNAVDEDDASIDIHAIVTKEKEAFDMIMKKVRHEFSAATLIKDPSGFRTTNVPMEKAIKMSKWYHANEGAIQEYGEALKKSTVVQMDRIKKTSERTLTMLKSKATPDYDQRMDKAVRELAQLEKQFMAKNDPEDTGVYPVFVDGDDTIDHFINEMKTLINLSINIVSEYTNLIAILTTDMVMNSGSFVGNVHAYQREMNTAISEAKKS